MSAIKFSNETARIHQNNGDNPAKVMKKVVKTAYEDRDYYPVMIELIHLLEKTHSISHEDDIIERIELMEKENPENVLTDGVFWQVGDLGRVMLLDERTLTTYKEVFENYLDSALVSNLKNFLEVTNQKRWADYLSASDLEKKEFKKIKIVTLG